MPQEATLSRKPRTLYGYFVALIYFFWYILKFVESIFYYEKGEKNPIIIIPVRDRNHHLKILLHHLGGKYRVLIVEQSEKGLFNRGLLFNAGVQYLEENNIPYSHLFLHDVDMIAIGRPYKCFTRPTIISSLLSRNYFFTHPYQLAGGVLSLPREDFLYVNGFSNNYFGWGCEDDDFIRRLKKQSIGVGYYPGVFRELHHKSNAKKSIYEKNRNQYNNNDDFSGYFDVKVTIRDNGIKKDATTIWHIVVDI